MSFLVVSQIDNTQEQKNFYIDAYEIEKTPKIKKLASMFCNKIYQKYGDIQDDILMKKLIKYSAKHNLSQNEIKSLFCILFLNYFGENNYDENKIKFLNLYQEKILKKEVNDIIISISMDEIIDL